MKAKLEVAVGELALNSIESIRGSMSAVCYKSVSTLFRAGSQKW